MVLSRSVTRSHSMVLSASMTRSLILVLSGSMTRSHGVVLSIGLTRSHDLALSVTLTRSLILVLSGVVTRSYSLVLSGTLTRSPGVVLSIALTRSSVMFLSQPMTPKKAPPTACKPESLSAHIGGTLILPWVCLGLHAKPERYHGLPGRVKALPLPSSPVQKKYTRRGVGFSRLACRRKPLPTTKNEGSYS